MQPGSFWATSYPLYDVVLVGTNQRTLGPFLSRLSYVKRRSSRSREKMPLEPRRKNGSCEIRIEKEKQKRRLTVSTLCPWSFQGRPTSSWDTQGLQDCTKRCHNVFTIAVCDTPLTPLSVTTVKNKLPGKGTVSFQTEMSYLNIGTKLLWIS